MQRWGIIYCPKQGIRRSHKRWEHIRQLLTERKVQYDFVQSEGLQSVFRLTQMLCKNGYTTIVIVGGDSALNQAINAIIQLGHDYRKSVTVGIIPNGRGNDYASFWGLNEDNDENTINALLQHRTRSVDVGVCTQSIDTEQTQRHYFLNCVNIGLLANIMNLKYKTRRLFGLSVLSYLSSMILLIFQRREWHVHFSVNEATIDRNVMAVCIGNAKGYGLTPSAVPYNGCLDVSVVSHPKLTHLANGIWMLFTGRFLNHRNVIAHRTNRNIQFAELQNAPLSVDGHYIGIANSTIDVDIEPEYINFIIPS